MPGADSALQIPRLPVFSFDSLKLGHAIEMLSVAPDRAVVLTTSGRAALLLALHALGVRKGDRVLLPTYHCPTMVAPVVRLGAIPVFYPIGRTAAPDAAFITSDAAAGAKILLAAHFFGLSLPLTDLRRDCDSRGILLIEDCAHAFFGLNEGRVVGSSGAVAIASLPKFFPVAEGGCLVASREAASRITLKPPTILGQATSVLDTLELGVRYRRLGALNVLLGLLFALKDLLRGRRRERDALPTGLDNEAVDKTRWLDEVLCERSATWMTRWIVRYTNRARVAQTRRRNYSLFSELLDDLPRARPLFPRLSDDAVPYVFPLHVDDPDPVYRAVREAGVPVFRWDQVWPGTPVLDGDVGLNWARNVFQLGCHQDMDEGDVQLVAATVRRALEQSSR
jgi:perosamine synthetase